MKIALFTDHFHPKTDGVVTTMDYTLSCLVELGHEVELFTVGQADLPHVGYKIHCFPGRKLFFYPERKFTGVNFRQVNEELNRFNPDIIHVINATFFFLPAWHYAQKHHRNLIFSLHTDYVEYIDHYSLKFFQNIVARILRSVNKKSDLFISTSQIMQKKLADLNIHNVKIWPCGVDIDLFSPNKKTEAMRSRLGFSEDGAKLVLNAGRMAPEKNLYILKDLVTQGKNINLSLVGDGPLRAKLEQHFSGTNTYFPGYMSHFELAQAFASSDVFVMPSTTETFGLAVLEAQASGCPVVAARAGGLAEIIHHGQDGFLFDPNHPEQCTQYVTLLCEDEQLRRQFAEQACKNAKNWSWEKATEKLCEFYNGVMIPEKRISLGV